MQETDIEELSLVRKCLGGEPPGNAFTLTICSATETSLNLETVVDEASLSFSVCTMNIETEKMKQD